MNYWTVQKDRLEKSDNGQFWINKISENIKRDNEVDKELLFLGWTVIRFLGKNIIKRMNECTRVVEEMMFDLKIKD